MYILNFCDEPEVLTVIYIIKILIKIISYAVPLVLIISLMIEFIKVIVTNNYALAKSIGNATKKIVASILLILIPTLVEIAITFVDENTSYDSCLASANRENISKKYEEKKSKNALLLEQKEQERKELAALNEAKQQLEKENNNYNYTNNNIGRVPVTTTNITTIGVTDLPIPLYTSKYASISKALPVNTAVASELHEILFESSEYIQNSSVIDRFQTAGAYVNKPGYHGRGLAIDLNNWWEFDYNGKKYKPYGGYKYWGWVSYKTMVCEVCNGKEDCPYNVNYHIFYRYFQPRGWCWGGNWPIEYFDPMHFELSDNGCYIKPKEFDC